MTLARLLPIVIVPVTCALSWGTQPGTAAMSTPKGFGEFEKLSMHIEVDLPGGTAELEFEAETEADLTHLALFDRSGMPLVAVDINKRSGLELNAIALGADGGSVGELLNTYPAGPYFVRGTTSHGLQVWGTVMLSPDLPARFHVVEPPDRGVLRRHAATLSWHPSAGAAQYTLEIEKDSGEHCLEVVLPTSCVSFTIPSEVLAAGSSYDYSLVARGDTDNEIEVEGSFTVAE